MSPRTVESHLSRVYREYGVRSRSQLVAALATPAGVSSLDEARSPNGPTRSDRSANRHHAPSAVESRA